MTVGELIAELQKLSPDIPVGELVCVEVVTFHGDQVVCLIGSDD